MKNGGIAALLVVALLAGAGAGYFIGNSNSQTLTSVSTTTVTVTPNPTTPLSRTTGEWFFAIRLQNPLVAMGQEFALSYNLTNISGQPQTVHEVDPLVNPTIYSANGTIVWAWNPPQSNGITTIPCKAGNWSSPLDIPTSALSAGQKYVLSVFPLIGANTTSAVAVGDYSMGESLMINATIGVT
jgi:hypothetical protein